MTLHKTIEINKDFFKVGGRSKKGSSVKTTQKKGRKAGPTVKPNTIKRELIKQIQRRKQEERDRQENDRVHMLRNAQLQEDETEFNQSIKYLQHLSQENEKKTQPVTPKPRRKTNTVKKSPI